MTPSDSTISMRKSRSRWWFVYGTATMLVGAALVWISIVVLQLEANAQHQQWLRLALWRMDGWLGPQLREESNRAYFEYLSFFPHERSYTRILNAIEPGEVYSPSPLRTFQSNYFPLHFQVDAQGEVTSPQVPQSNWRDLAEAGYLGPDAIASKQPLFDRVAHLLGPRNLEACVDASRSALSQMLNPAPPSLDELPTLPPAQTLELQSQSESQKVISKADLQWRMNSNYNTSTPQTSRVAGQLSSQGVVAPATVEIGNLVPVWLRTSENSIDDDRARELLFVRQVQIGNQTLFQGVLADWPRIREAMLALISDLFPGADLVPLSAPTAADAESGRMLASAPVLLAADCPVFAGGPLITASRTALATMWLASFATLIAVANTLRASIAYGEKRSRFASAVTHELRTPLTTFRLYSEMLAEGMVRDESQRAVYLDALKTESARLARLVDNVLSYARLEQGRVCSSRQRMTVGSMLERTVPDLERRASSCGMVLCVKTEDRGQSIMIDADSVGQILFNLVDNACKYAGREGAHARVIDLDCRVRGGWLDIIVRDHGTGISPMHRKTIFKPFERGSHQPGDPIPGVGLGLALARGLARDLGGDLSLIPNDAVGNSQGAVFRLSVPAQ